MVQAVTPHPVEPHGKATHSPQSLAELARHAAQEQGLEQASSHSKKPHAKKQQEKHKTHDDHPIGLFPALQAFLPHQPWLTGQMLASPPKATESKGKKNPQPNHVVGDSHKTADHSSEMAQTGGHTKATTPLTPLTPSRHTVTKNDSMGLALPNTTQRKNIKPQPPKNITIQPQAAESVIAEESFPSDAKSSIPQKVHNKIHGNSAALDTNTQPQQTGLTMTSSHLVSPPQKPPETRHTPLHQPPTTAALPITENPTAGMTYQFTQMGPGHSVQVMFTKKEVLLTPSNTLVAQQLIDHGAKVPHVASDWLLAPNRDHQQQNGQQHQNEEEQGPHYHGDEDEDGA